MRQIVLATANKGKAKEFTSFFNRYNINAISLFDLEKSIPAIEETGSDFKENAALKSEQVALILNEPTIADDSGLVIDALDGAPGIFSARYAGKGSTDEANMKKVIEQMKDIPQKKRTARFVCVLAISIPGKQTVLHSGYCEGTIAFSQVGTNGFGYDPIFIPKRKTKTMAELCSEEKNKISHRGQAFKQLAKWLNEHYIERDEHV